MAGCSPIALAEAPSLAVHTRHYSYNPDSPQVETTALFCKLAGVGVGCPSNMGAHPESQDAALGPLPSKSKIVKNNATLPLHGTLHF